MPINAIGTGLPPVGAGQTPGSSETTPRGAGMSFGDALGKMVDDVKSSSGRGQ